MTPYFEADGVTLYCGEALATLAELAPPVDAFITDLPYGTTACSWDVVIPFEPMWAEVKRLLQPRGVFVTTASQPFTSALVMSNLAWFKYEWIWEKDNGANFLQANTQPIKAHENILVFAQGLTIYNPQKTHSTYKHSRCDRVHRSQMRKDAGLSVSRFKSSAIYEPDKLLPRSIQYFSRNVPTGGSQHPTPKPVALYEYLIRTYTNPGALVCDFCAGSGTTGVAAIRTGRRVILIEQHEPYCEIAARRLERELLQPRLIPVADVGRTPEQGGLW